MAFFIIYLLNLSSSLIRNIYIRNQNTISANQVKNFFKFMPFGVSIHLQNHAQMRESENDVRYRM